ncbi:predicted protein [Naegleria gruberi]|uniref:Predicted protein n=1 Tax=Naegleria gruberi TaxID=5762 RepID=D2W2C1_NAEGR|nr:uncharacterized protein NAEGRDRAFT_75536 [Naegleria gruberi]EFC36836.1 predicted protein [Naegleria gruberi]|eukprot:XP_002669580.1 predicted protein [Naegleria gruberi strain NEG-M]
MNLILPKDDMENYQQHLTELIDRNNQQQYQQQDYSSPPLPTLFNIQSDDHQQDQISYMINNKIHEFLASMLSHQESNHQLSNNTIGNPTSFYQMQSSSSSPSLPSQEEEAIGENRSQHCSTPIHPHSLPLSTSHNFQICGEETVRKDPEDLIFTQKKQNQDDYCQMLPLSQLQHLFEMKDGCVNCVKTNLDESECNLMLSFTENEMEMIEQRFMNGLYSKLAQNIKQEKVDQQQQIYQKVSANSSTAADDHATAVGNSIRNQPKLEMQSSQVSNNLLPVQTMNHQTLCWNSPSKSQESSAVSNNSFHLPKQARLPKRKKRPLMSTSVDSTPMMTMQNNTSSHQQSNHNNNYSKVLGPPPINTKKVSKKRDRNNSVSDSPTKKTTSSNSTNTSIYRGHVSNSNSFSKESPWQFHTYSEGKRNQSENLVFFHFNPKRS